MFHTTECGEVFNAPMVTGVPPSPTRLPCSVTSYHRVVVQSLHCVQLFATQWTAARQASLSFTISLSLLQLMSMESVMPSNHLILGHSLLLLSSFFPSIRVFSNADSQPYHPIFSSFTMVIIIFKNLRSEIKCQLQS